MCRLIIFLLLATSLSAQTASLTGRLTDPAGATVPAANLTLTNTGTSTAFRSITNADGYFLIPALPPGEYRLQVEKSGFKSVKQSGIKLDVGQTARLDYTMQVGAVSDSVEVSAQALLLDSETSSLGQVIGGRQVTELPLLGRNAYALAALVPGVRTSVGMNDLPVDQISTVSASINGSRAGQNEFLLDGAPNTAAAQNQPVIFQNVDSVQEFKVETNTFSAEYGRSAGGVFNVVTKSGANRLTFTAYEFLRNNSLNANDFFANRAGRSKAPFRFNQFGGVIGGPIVKNKTFFFLATEIVRFSQGMTWTASVPRPEQLTGDFSNTRNGAGQLITVFDPATTASNGAGGFTRAAFPGNLVPPSRFDPVSRNMAKFLPAPNATGANNFVRTDSNRVDKNTWSARFDHNLNDKNRLFGRYSYDDTPWLRSATYGADNIASPTFGAQTFTRRNMVIEDTHVLSPSAVGMLRGSWSRLSNFRRPYSFGFDPTTLGLPASLVRALPVAAFPVITITGLSTASSVGNVGNGAILGGADLISFGMDTYALQGSVTRTLSKFTIKAGAETRVIRFNAQQTPDTSTTFGFSPAFTQGPNPAASSATAGVALASFLLGTPASGTVTPAPALAMQTLYYAGFVQADWKVTPKLTVNMGLRYDYEAPRTDRFNQFTNFDSNLAPKVKDVPGLKGALSFVGVGGESRYQTNPDKNNISPRLGFAWQALSKTVVRGGMGLFYGTMLGVGGAGTNFGVSGFSAVTTMVTSLDGVTPYRYLNNPYPEGLVPATGSSLGAGTLLGQAISATDRGNYVPYSAQWNFDVQRELPGGILLDVGYAGNRGIGFQQDRQLNTLPDSALALGDALRAPMANPFFGQVGSGILAQRTVTRAQLLRPFQQFDGITSVNNPWANSKYHALQMKAQKRYTKGLTMMGAWTYSKLLDYGIGPFGGEALGGAGFQNWNNLRSEWGVSSSDQTHRLVFNAVYDLPGFNNSPSALLKRIFGGWQVGGIVSLLSGGPLGVGSAVNNTFSQGGGQRPNWNGVQPAVGTRNPDQWLNASVFSNPASYTYGNSPRTFGGTRGDRARNLDLTIGKNIQIHERLRLQFRSEFFNLTNTARFAPPNQAFGNPLFGFVTSQLNQPRIIQFGLKLLY